MMGSSDSGPERTVEGPAEPPYPSSRTAWWTVGVLTLLYSVSMMDRQVFNLLADSIGRSLEISDFQLSLLSGFAFALFYAVFGLPCGWAADRFRRRGLIFGGVFIWSLATACCGLARTFGQFAVARVAVGGGEAALNPAAYSIISDIFPRRRLSTAISVFATGAMIGGLASKLIAASVLAVLPHSGLDLPLLGPTEAWRIVFLTVGLPGALLGCLVWTFSEPVRRQRLHAAPAASFLDALAYMAKRWRFYGPFFLGASLISAANNGFAAWSPAFFIRNHGLTASETGFLMAPMTIVPQLIGLLVAGLIADRWFARGRTTIHLQMIAVLGAAKAVLIWIAMTNDLPVMTTAVLLGLATLFSGVAGIGPAALQLVTPNDYRGQVAATYLFLTTLLGLGAGPAVVGAITTYGFEDPAMVGWAVAITFAGAAPLAALSLWAAMHTLRRLAREAETWAPAGQAA